MEEIVNAQETYINFLHTIIQKYEDFGSAHGMAPDPELIHEAETLRGKITEEREKYIAAVKEFENSED